MSSMASSSSNSQSSPPEYEWLYDVFLTCRTNDPSVKALKTCLSDAGLKTFVDNDGNITPTLLLAIELSRIVIVFWTNEFLDSRGCLEKLNKIMECRKIMGKEVLTVFCRVADPWLLDKDIGRSANGFQLQKLRCRRGVNEFLYSLPTWKVPTSCTRHSELIREIAFHAKMKLGNTGSGVPRHHVGLRFRVNEVLHLSNYYSSGKVNATVVGIWGTGGIGKTTLARAIYDTISYSLENKTFLKNIKNPSEKDKGLVYLQEQGNIIHIGAATTEMTKRIAKGRALVVLDDVSEVDQLIRRLSTTIKNYGIQSMALITTRNKDVFDYIKGKDHVYEMKKLDRSESLELFKRNAFNQVIPQRDFIDIAEVLIKYCEGLPLLLEVLGSLLFGRTKSEWESVLRKLKSIPTGQIHDKLKISIEHLDDWVKEIFINIAHFHVGKKKEHVAQKLSGFPFPVETGIRMLIERSLVKVDKHGKLDMHDLLQEIGKKISSNNSKPKYVYNVFLSFRGEDTRKSFATHLYVTLKKAGIEVFMDNGIRSGKNISSSLIQAIESSCMSIIIFSINYASSSWCLQELEKIMECHRITGQEVFPIFYYVQPSDVRKQIGTFGEALEGLMKKNPISKDKKLNWTRALTEAANLSGWNSNDYRTDAELIDHVVETITMKLDDTTYLFVAHHPVGVKPRVQEIIQLFSVKSHDTIIVGIVGMGGIGKTTIAKAIYNEIGRSFKGKSFLANIREVWEQENGQVNLQQQLLSDLTQTRSMKLYSVELGKAMVKERLRHGRALLVLDDVDNRCQLNALCGSREWFGPGSRIIVTTRDEHLLRILRVDNVYNMKEMNNGESLELFSWHAFKQASPIEDFVDLSIRVISYSEGLPLALEILGSYLCDRTMQAWESVLEKLQGIPNDQIHKKLKISYDGLSDDTEKDIFLDICCFFIGKDRYYVTKVLDDCGFHAEIGITRLIELSLVKIDKNNKLHMHGLIRDMGREIIRQGSPKEPEKRTRLWSCDDVVEVLRNHMGTTVVDGLALNLSRTKALSFDTKAFKMMKRLRLLQLGHVKLVGKYEYLSKVLRWLHWHGFPLHYMPEDFDHGNIVAIDLKYSNLISVWKNCQLLENLKFLNLSHSQYLIQAPDFSKLPHLERLILKDCPRLSSIHPSIGDLKYLILVNLKKCKDLSNLPRSFYTTRSLKTLNLSGCSKIEKLEEDIEQMESLTTLQANGTAIIQAPFSLTRLRSIKYVSLCGHEGFSHDVIPALFQPMVPVTKNPWSIFNAFPRMPFLLRSLLHNFSNHRSAKLEAGPSTSRTLSAKTPALTGFHDQVHNSGAENFLSSLTIRVGGFNKVIDTLLGSISQEWSNRGLGCSLPGDSCPTWLAFENEGSSVSFKVSQVLAHCLKGMILCIIYSSPQDSMADVYPVTFKIKNFTKATTGVHKRDAVTATDEDEWQKIISNLEPGNEVEINVDFARKYTIKKTAVYLVYGEEIENGSGMNITKTIIE